MRTVALAIRPARVWGDFPRRLCAAFPRSARADPVASALMNDANPPVCAAWLPLPAGQALCELPVGHAGPHRAFGPPHAPGGEPVAWSGLPRRRVALLDDERTLGAA